MSVVQSQGGVTHNLLPLHFSRTDVPDANGTLNGVQATTNEYVMPRGGSILGVSASPNGTLVTGTLQFQALINGSLCPAFTDSSALLHTNQTYPYWMGDARRANLTFTAGQRIGLNFNASDTIAPTTRDVNVLLYVLLEDVRY